jgi:hypothetical protein
MSSLEALSREIVEQIAAASERWQTEQAARLDAANLGEHIDGRAIIGPGLTQATLDELKGSPTRAAFRQLIADLEPQAMLELVGLLRIGREDDDDADVVTALEQAEHKTHASAADYIAGRAPLGRYLRRGLERIGTT